MPTQHLQQPQLADKMLACLSATSTCTQKAQHKPGIEMEEHASCLPAKSRKPKQNTIVIPTVSSAKMWCNYSNKSCVEMQYLCSHLSNVIQPVHHVVQQLQLLLCQFAQIQRSRSTTGLDDTGNILQAPTSLLSVLTATKREHATNVTYSQTGPSSQATVHDRETGH